MEVENDDMGTLMYEMSVQTGEVVIWPGANASQLTAITIVFSQQLAIQLLPRPTSNNPLFFFERQVLRAPWFTFQKSL